MKKNYSTVEFGGNIQICIQDTCRIHSQLSPLGHQLQTTEEPCMFAHHSIAGNVATQILEAPPPKPPGYHNHRQDLDRPLVICAFFACGQDGRSSSVDVGADSNRSF